MPDSYPIPNVTPAFTFQNPGLGAVIQQGVTGLLHSIQAKKELDQADERLQQEQKDFELRQAQQKTNALMTQEQIAQWQFTRKQTLEEFEQKQEALGQQREGLRFFNMYNSEIGTGADPVKALGHINDLIGKSGGGPGVHSAFVDNVIRNADAAKAVKKPERPPPTPRWTPIGVTPDGKSVVMNNLTGEQRVTDISLAGKGGGAGGAAGMAGGNPSVQERNAFGIYTIVKDGMKNIERVGTPTPLANIASKMPVFGNFLTNEQQRTYTVELSKVITAIYAISGKQLTDNERTAFIRNYGYDAFDGPVTGLAKRNARAVLLEATRMMAGRALPPSEQPTQVNPVAQQYAESLQQWATTVQTLRASGQNQNLPEMPYLRGIPGSGTEGVGTTDYDAATQGEDWADAMSEYQRLHGGTP